jgi:hypothetical protein
MGHVTPDFLDPPSEAVRNAVEASWLHEHLMVSLREPVQKLPCYLA